MIKLCGRFVVPRIEVQRVPRGRRGMLATARLIAQLIRDGAKDFYVRQKAIEIFCSYGASPENRMGEVSSAVRVGPEKHPLPMRHLSNRASALCAANTGIAGDCDDMTNASRSARNRQPSTCVTCVSLHRPCLRLIRQVTPL